MKSWPNIYKQKKGWIVDCGLMGGTKRVREYCTTKKAADEFAAAKREQRQLEKMGVQQLTPAERIDAAAAMRLIRGTGITLESLARAAVERGTKKSILIADLYAEYAARRKKAGLRSRSLAGIKSREGRFSTDLGGVDLAELNAGMIDGWLKKHNIGAVSRNAYLRGVRTMLNYAVRQGYIQRNPASQLDFAKTEIELPVVFSIDQANAILHWCAEKCPDLVPYYALGFFAGIRPDELKRLTSNEINFKDRLITILPAASKTHMRHVHIRPNLIRWLAKYRVKGPVYWKRYHVDRMTDDLCIQWPKDVCRKSFISYHLAAFRNLQETILEAGHRDSQMIFTHYRNIRATDGTNITSDYAAGWWRINPVTVSSWAKNKPDAFASRSQNSETKTES